MSGATEEVRSLDDVRAVAAKGPAPIEVDGSGPLATRLRERLGLGEQPPDERPGTVVETTGEVARIECAMRRVDDLGTVILAGPRVNPHASIDLYADLHVRGLTVIAVGRDPDARE